MIVDDTSVFWQWQADDVLKQPDLVRAGARRWFFEVRRVRGRLGC